ncbi:hypothetical protein PUN28_011080 [Cardiocondyla obscurior]|uniref:Uncharacterized protein n=1 Tax=Cardiocondyla obscurior TaxID=286306 RepID=A0AAW2FJ22_9HYME
MTVKLRVCAGERSKKRAVARFLKGPIIFFFFFCFNRDDGSESTETYASARIDTRSRRPCTHRGTCRSVPRRRNSQSYKITRISPDYARGGEKGRKKLDSDMGLPLSRPEITIYSCYDNRRIIAADG